MDLEYESYLKNIANTKRHKLSYEDYYRVMKESKDDSQKLIDELNIKHEDIIFAMAASLDFFVANTPFTMPELSPKDIERTVDLMKSMGIDSSIFNSLNKP